MKTHLLVTLAASAVSMAAGLTIALLTKDTSSVTVSSIYREQEEGVYTEHFFEDEISISHTIENLQIIEQLPELPTGCEVTSLTMVLNFWGIGTSKTDIAQNYLDKEALEVGEDEKLYGPDFRYVFAGDPEDDTSFGCLAPCITSTAKKYISDKNAGSTAEDITGTSFYKLFEYIEKDIPVIIWYTMGLVEPQYVTSWITHSGETVIWPTNEHCVVLSAYDYSKNTVRLHDPVDGVVTVNMEKVKERYDQLGKNAVVITAENSEYKR